MEAIRHGHKAIAELLIANKADVNATDNKVCSQRRDIIRFHVNGSFWFVGWEHTLETSVEI